MKTTLTVISVYLGGHHDPMVVGFISTYAISVSSPPLLEWELRVMWYRCLKLQHFVSSIMVVSSIVGKNQSSRKDLEYGPFTIQGQILSHKFVSKYTTP
jgi:hypothetical protein